MNLLFYVFCSSALPVIIITVKKAISLRTQCKTNGIKTRIEEAKSFIVIKGCN